MQTTVGMGFIKGWHLGHLRTSLHETTSHELPHHSFTGEIRTAEGLREKRAWEYFHKPQPLNSSLNTCNICPLNNENKVEMTSSLLFRKILFPFFYLDVCPSIPHFHLFLHQKYKNLKQPIYKKKKKQKQCREMKIHFVDNNSLGIILLFSD